MVATISIFNIMVVAIVVMCSGVIDHTLRSDGGVLVAQSR